MRVLVLTADYPPRNWSGIGVAVAFQARALRSLGCDVRVMTTAEHLAPTSEDPPIYRLSPRRFPVTLLGDEVVHVHSLRLVELAIELSDRFRLPLLYTAHTIVQSELERSESSRCWAAIQQRVFERADSVFFLNAGQRAEALAVVPTLSPRSAVLPNSVPAPTHRMHRPAPEKRIVFAGRFTHKKGIDVAMEVSRRLLAREHSLTFEIAGGHGEPDVQRRVLEFARTESRVGLMGWLGPRALERFFSEATLVLMPSRYEPFGMLALQAMRAGAPVVASRAGGLNDIFQPEAGGIGLNNLDADQWEENCLRLLNEPDERHSLAAKGPRYVESRYNSTQLARQYLEMIAQ